LALLRDRKGPQVPFPGAYGREILLSKTKTTTWEGEMATRRDFIGGMTGAMAGVAFAAAS
jgi:hypothetical protein